MGLIDFRLRKSVHTALLVDTHKDLKKTLIDKELSIQEVFQKFSELIIAEDKSALKILEHIQKEKREGKIKKAKFEHTLNISNVENIYDLIGDISKNDSSSTGDKENENS